MRSAFAIGLLCLVTAAIAGEKPNLLVIHTDEHNFRTLGCYRAQLPPEQALAWGKEAVVQTPHIDSLARDGVLCNRFYAASPVCTPSRASFVSGRFPQTTGAIQNNLPMSDGVITFAEALRRAGYATGYAGKWHVDGPARPGWGPTRKFGFEDNRFMFNRGHWKQLAMTDAGPRVKATNAKGQPTYAVDGADEKSFTTDFLAGRAIEFIKANKGRPFCYMLSIPDPHGPNTVRPPYDRQFAGMAFDRPPSATGSGKDLPGYASVLKGGANGKQMALYFGMVKCIDDNVGKLLAALRSEGLLENTIVVFTADHGDMCGEHGRDNKGIPLEASAKVPFIVRYPAKLRPGTVVREALGTADFKPTILALMGVKSEGDEGRNASPLLLAGKAPDGWKDITFSRIGGEGGGWMMAVTSRCKFIVSPSDDPCLFDLEADPWEMTNLLRSAEHRPIMRTLATELEAWARTHNEPHLKSATVRADLAWAMGEEAKYVAPKRAPQSRNPRPDGEDDE